MHVPTPSGFSCPGRRWRRWKCGVTSRRHPSAQRLESKRMRDSQGCSPSSPRSEKDFIHATISGMTLGELAERLGAELVAGEGEDTAAAKQRAVTGVAGIETASATEVTFVANPKYAGLARKSTVSTLSSISARCRRYTSRSWLRLYWRSRFLACYTALPTRRARSCCSAS